MSDGNCYSFLCRFLGSYYGIEIQWISDQLRWRACPKRLRVSTTHPAAPPAGIRNVPGGTFWKCTWRYVLEMYLEVRFGMCGQLLQGFFPVCVNFQHRTWITDKQLFSHAGRSTSETIFEFCFYTIRDVWILLLYQTRLSTFSFIPKGTLLIIWIQRNWICSHHDIVFVLWGIWYCDTLFVMFTFEYLTRPNCSKQCVNVAL